MRATSLALLLLAQQDPQFARDFSGSLWEEKVLVAEIKAEQAAITDMQSMSGEYRNGDVTYYTQPSPKEMSQKVKLHFGIASVDGKKKTFGLREHVEVRMEDGSTIETPDLLVNHPLQTLVTKSAVRVTRSNLSLVGIGLEADNTLKQIAVPRDGILELVGRPADLYPRPGRPPRPPAKMVTRLRCDGPLSIRDLSVGAPGGRRFTMITAREGVHIEREEGGRKIAAATDSAVIYFARVKDGAFEPVSLTLRGSVELEDSAGGRARAETADWDAQDDLLRLTGKPHVEMHHAGQRVRSLTAVIDRWAGRAFFAGDLAAKIAPSPGGQTLDLFARELEIRAETLAGRPQASTITATGHVHLTGEAGPPAGGRIDAVGTSFTWNAIEERGLLAGLPYARVDQGESRIQAPEIVFEGRSMFVVKGPKRLRFVHAEPPGAFEKAWAFAAERPAGRRTVIAASSQGDVTYDATSGRVTLRDACEVTTEDFRLTADFLRFRLAQDGSGVDDLSGSGAVRVEANGMRLAGQALSYRPQDRVVEVRGEPYVVALFHGIESHNAIVRLDQATGRIELEGGRYAGRIWLPK